MSENKFIKKLRGEPTPKALVEIQNNKLIAPFKGLPNSTDINFGTYNDADTAIIIAKSAQNWTLDGDSLISGEDTAFISESDVGGAGMWLNANYTFPASGVPNNPVSAIFNPNSKWILRLVGKDLMSPNETIGFSLIVKIGTAEIANINVPVKRQAGYFCKKFIVDFSESASDVIHANVGDNLTVQLICDDVNATAMIYNGSTILSVLERKIDSDTIASANMTFEEVVGQINQINQNIGNMADLLPSDVELFPDNLVDAINAERTDRHAAINEEIIARQTAINEEATARQEADADLEATKVAYTDIDNQTPVEPQANRVPSTELMVKRVFSTKPKLTGVISESWLLGQKIVELPDGSGLNVPAFQIFVNKENYYGTNEGDFAVVQFQDRPWLIPNMGSGTQKAFYVYATIDGQIVYMDISPYGYLSADRCYLGSGFAVKDGSTWKIQANSWKSQPWIPESSLELRVDPLNKTGSVNFKPIAPLQMALDQFRINGEGFNFEHDRGEPNTALFAGQSPVKFKRFYPGYSATEVETDDWSTLNVWYNQDTGLLEPVPADGTAVSIAVAFATPAGQIGMMIQQGTTANPGYFPAGVGESLVGMPNLQYDLTNISTRIIPMGICWAVLGGLTDVSNPLQLSPFQNIPASLKVYGETAGGGSGAPVTGFTVFDKDGNQMGTTGGVREIKASKNVKLSVAGVQVSVESPDPLDDVNAAQQREIERNDNAKAGDTGYVKGTMVVANVNETDDLDYVVETRTGLTGTNYAIGWYRKWKSGWVEQGGQFTSSSAAPGITTVLPVPMRDTTYAISLTCFGDFFAGASNLTATSFGVSSRQWGSSGGSGSQGRFYISGYAA